MGRLMYSAHEHSLILSTFIPQCLFEAQFSRRAPDKHMYEECLFSRSLVHDIINTLKKANNVPYQISTSHNKLTFCFQQRTIRGQKIPIMCTKQEVATFRDSALISKSDLLEPLFKDPTFFSLSNQRE
jgi:hypothetical protein